MKSSVRISIMVAVVLLGMALVIAGSYFLALYAIGQSQRNWCTALSLLTHDPVPKPAPGNVARLQNYNFYIDLVILKSHFGC
jgi:hypothetical protein